MGSLDVLSVTAIWRRNVYNTASFHYHPHKVVPLLCHVDSGKSLVDAAGLACYESKLE